MKIVQVAPLYERVPPVTYGGTERIVSYLTEELVAQGHEVKLFASGDSLTSATLVAGCPQSLRLSGAAGAGFALHLAMLERVYREVGDYDLIHFHVDYLHFPLTRREGFPHLTTMHGRLDFPEHDAIFREFREMPLISISENQRAPLPFANWIGTVQHGLPRDLFTFNDHPQGYLAFLGRISPEKRVDRAIEIAMRTGIPIRIAAKIDDADRAYFEEKIRPLFALPGVEYVGEIEGEQKNRFLGNARALLFPIDWPEPFGLVMIEALATGTPVIAWRNGSVPEVIEPGVSGFIVDSMNEAVEAVTQLPRLSRKLCRARFEARFTVEQMAQNYVRLYEKILASESSHARTAV